MQAGFARSWDGRREGSPGSLAVKDSLTPATRLREERPSLTLIWTNVRVRSCCKRSGQPNLFVQGGHRAPDRTSETLRTIPGRIAPLENQERENEKPNSQGISISPILSSSAACQPKLPDWRACGDPQRGHTFPNFFRERQNLRNRLETGPSSTRRQRKKRNRSGGVAGARRHSTRPPEGGTRLFRSPLEYRLQAEADSMPRSKATGLVNGLREQALRLMAIGQARLNKLALSALATRERSTGERRRVERNK